MPEKKEKELMEVRTTVSIDQSTYNAAQRQAEKLDRSFSYMVRTALRQMLGMRP